MRVHLRRPLAGGVWLDRDVPATSVETTVVINGAGSIEITVPVDYPTRRGEDGRALISEWDAELIVEDDAGRIIQAGIVDEIRPGTDWTEVSAGGLSMYPTGMPWEAAPKAYTAAHAVDVLKDVFAHLQSKPNGNVGVSVAGSSKVVMGVGALPPWRDADAARARAQQAYDKAHAAVTGRTKETKSLWASVFHAAGMVYIGTVKKSKTAPTADRTKIIWVNTANKVGPSAEGAFMAWDRKAGAWVRKDASATAYEAWKTANAAEKTARNKQAATKAALDAAKEALKKVESQAADPYTLTWWETQDLGQVLTDLVSAGVEYMEETVWAGDDVAHRLVVRDPSQVRRDSLRFEIGVNIQTLPEQGQALPYTDVLVLGAGEGTKKLRSSTSWGAGGRVRRVRVVTDPDARTSNLVANRAAAELKRIKASMGAPITSLVVTDHPYARWSQYGPGDLIRVVGELPDGTDVDQWVRVLEMTFPGSTDTVTLKVEAAE